MEVKAVAKYVRISPLRVQQVMNIIRGKDIQEAYATLKFTPKKASFLIEKVLKSAVANAENNFELDVDKLYVKSCFVDNGPIMKRQKPRAMGRADMIRKRTSHITVVVSEKKEG